MGILEAIVLGIIQGLTEFLPVSSSGHLAVARHFFGEVTGSVTFEVAVHVGTVLSVLTVYFQAVKRVLSDIFEFLRSRRLTIGAQLTVLVILASVPAGLTGIFLKDFFVGLFENMWVVIGGFVLTGVILFSTRKVPDSASHSNFFAIDDKIQIRWWQALVIGMAQALAITPGISRSGSTIAAGLLTGVDRRSAALFSFMLAVPVILGAGLLEVRHIQSFGLSELKSLAVGLIVSYLVGVFGLKVIVSFVRKGQIHYFSYYLWSLALVLSVYQIWRP